MRILETFVNGFHNQMISTQNSEKKIAMDSIK